MTFTKNIKKEILSNCNIKKFNLTYLKGIVFSCNLVEIHDNQVYVQIKVNSFVRNVLYEVEENYGVQIVQLKNMFIIELPYNNKLEQLNWIIDKHYIENKLISGIDSKNLKREFIKSCFVLNGSVSNPNSFYHLEIKMYRPAYCLEFSKILNKFDITFKIINRGKHSIAYVKESEKIADCIRVLEANNSLLEFENNRIIKEVRNKINIKQNYELANLNKTIKTAVKQQSYINHIFSALKEDEIPEDLIQIMKLRLNTETLSLQQLGDLHNPKITKSTVNYKFIKIKKISENLRRKENDIIYTENE